MKRRVENARQMFKGLDGILFCSDANVQWLSGYSGTEAVLVLGTDEVRLFVDSRNTTQARAECAEYVEVQEIKNLWEEVYPRVQSLGISCLGVESNVMDVDTYMKIKNLFKDEVELTPLGAQLAHLRSVKDETELECMRHAAAVASAAVDRVLEAGIVGRSEREVALDMEWAMRTAGASGVSFDFIVAAGERGAMPHGLASERVIGRDEAVVLDFGCIVDGYCSDETITVFTGNPDEEFFAAYHHVFTAQQLAVEALCAGKRAVEVDRVARGYLERQGLGRWFGHGLGHGVGRLVHETPTLSPRSEDILQAGMVVTVEPGVYLPGRFGIRTEDTFVITDNSCQRITNLDKDSIRIIS